MDATDIATSSAEQATGSSSWMFTLPTTAPSGRTAGLNDFLYLVLVSDVTPTTPTGWTRIGPLQLGATAFYVSVYIRTRQVSDTSVTFAFASPATGTMVMLSIPTAAGTANLVAQFYNSVPTTPDPYPVNFVNSTGGLRIFTVVGTAGGTIGQANSNRWTFLESELPASVPTLASWAHLGVGAVDQFELETTTGFSYRLHHADITFDLGATARWRIGRIGWPT